MHTLKCRQVNLAMFGSHLWVSGYEMSSDLYCYKSKLGQTRPGQSAVENP